ncbi:Deoxyribonuclease I [Methanohalobium evestigatum Z-7303]|uniref:Deoxyribonuclease I n=1 Tax=Methanohalobium evestigatum (strain ATCC BAA-1072 / DSM 3721 / NBRC 107634 / OCM 161 / Z-7303) TaxID=644295 RepID=D7E828_METEZ|nr:lamin tail domain-containing protein [Methanohalobium evestigatum]ADI73370.1 Deoxyribonuclease I [Methanohalobium evestigatum Z-7303]
MKKITKILIIMLLFTSIAALGCTENSDTGVDGTNQNDDNTETENPNQDNDSKEASLNESDTLRIGAFNIQVFGTSKASEPETMNTIAKIIRNYDIIAIQEIRDKSENSLPQLVELVNEGDYNYDFVMSERLGRTVSKEQYAYIYNTATVDISNNPHTYPEPEGTDPFHRQPYIASFEAVNGNFDATFITVHTDPDEATEEINALDSVVEYTHEKYSEERDFIVMGDLNADGSYFDEDLDSTMHNDYYYWCIGDDIDTTTGSTDYTYDRIIITEPAMEDFTDDAHIYRYDDKYDLKHDETMDVSDHYPVYATFWTNKDDDNITSNYTPSEQTLTSENNGYINDSSTEDHEDVYISDLSLEDEWVKITNPGETSVDLNNWKIEDEANHAYEFTDFTLGPNNTVTLYTDEGTDAENQLYWGSGRAIWNNDGDNAYLYDSTGELVDSYQGD